MSRRSQEDKMSRRSEEGPTLHTVANKSRECSEGETVHQTDLTLIKEIFPQCKDFLGVCGLNVNNTGDFGTCLNTKYPATKTLNLGRTLSSGHGSVSFKSDRDCTDFVHQFFPSCGEYLQTCSQVDQDPDSAALIVGCLFGQYPSLMVPLLSVEEDLKT